MNHLRSQLARLELGIDALRPVTLISWVTSLILSYWGFYPYCFIPKTHHTACPMDHQFTTDLTWYLFLCVPTINFLNSYALHKKFSLPRVVPKVWFLKNSDIPQYSLASELITPFTQYILISKKIVSDSALAQDSLHLLELIWVTMQSRKSKCFIVPYTSLSALITSSQQINDVPLYVLP